MYYQIPVQYTISSLNGKIFFFMKIGGRNVNPFLYKINIAVKAKPCS